MLGNDDYAVQLPTVYKTDEAEGLKYISFSRLQHETDKEGCGKQQVFTKASPARRQSIIVKGVTSSTQQGSYHRTRYGISYGRYFVKTSIHLAPRMTRPGCCSILYAPSFGNFVVSHCSEDVSMPRVKPNEVSVSYVVATIGLRAVGG